MHSLEVDVSPVKQRSCNRQKTVLAATLIAVVGIGIIAEVASMGRSAQLHVAQFQTEDDGGIPRIIHFSVEHCDGATMRKIQGNLRNANVTGFRVLCHGASFREAYVRHNLPDYAQFYVHLTTPMMIADVFRYMVLHQIGGFYLDDDVELFPSFREHFERMRFSQIIVGWERRTDSVPIGTWCSDFGGMLCNSLALWAVAAVPKQDAIHDLIVTWPNYFESHNDHDNISDQDVLKHTGPVHFTNRTGPVHFTNRMLKFVEVEEVLGIEAFGYGQAHSTSPVCDPSNDKVWMKHRSEGKWHGQGMSQPQIFEKNLSGFDEDVLAYV